MKPCSSDGRLSTRPVNDLEAHSSGSIAIMKPTFPLTRALGGIVATLIVLIDSVGFAQPANDLFAKRQVISGSPVIVNTSNAGGTLEGGEPLHAGNRGGASIWFSWKAPSTGTATITTAGSTIDTILGVYSGNSISALTELASNDDEDYPSRILTSKVTFEITANQVCQIAVDGFSGAWGDVRLTVQMGVINPEAPLAPAWQFPDQNGVLVRSTDFAGKVVILDFWATWCGPCKAGMPDLVDLQNRYRGDGLCVIGADVSWSGDSMADVRGFMATWTPTINYRMVMSASPVENAYGGIGAIPTTFIIDRDNRIRQKYVGTQAGITLERQIVPLLFNNTQITYRRSGSQLTLSWPVTTVPFTLYSTTSLADPVWAAWPTAPTVSNGNNSVQVPLSGAPRFFRLLLNN